MLNCTHTTLIMVLFFKSTFMHFILSFDLTNFETNLSSGSVSHQGLLTCLITLTSINKCNHMKTLTVLYASSVFIQQPVTGSPGQRVNGDVSCHLSAYTSPAKINMCYSFRRTKAKRGVKC